VPTIKKGIYAFTFSVTHMPTVTSLKQIWTSALP